jgi:hypothetical protein
MSELLTSRRLFPLRFRLKITGVMALVQLTGEFASDAVDHSPALDGWPLADRVDPALNVPILLCLKEFGSLIEPALGQTCVPGPDGDIGDGVVAASDVFVRFESPVEHVQLTLRLHGEPIYGIFDPSRRVGVAVTEAPTKVRRASRLPEQPREAFGARAVSGRQEDAELLGEIYQDGARLEYPNRHRAALVHQRRDLGVGVQGNEAAPEQIALVNSDQPGVVLCAAIAERK